MSHVHLFRFTMLAAGFFFALFLTAEARYIDANIQCPPGGKIGQPCKDNTNGYVTSGKCQHIYICKADDYQKPPPQPCSGGDADCPKGGPAPSADEPSASSTEIYTLPTIPGDSSSASGALSAFGESDGEEGEETETVRSFGPPQQGKVPVVIPQAGEKLEYSSQSFDKKVSTLYASLRASAAGLSSAGGAPRSEKKAQAGVSGMYGVSSFAIPIVDSVNDLAEIAGYVPPPEFYAALEGVKFLASAVYNALQGILSILLADFTQAGIYFGDASTDIKNAFSLFIQLLILIFQRLVQLVF